MANGNIKGITIELGADTTKLGKALQSVTSESISLQSELKTVDKLLKFNPGNADLIAQKQEILAKQIENTSKKLETLKEAQAQVDEQFANGKINEEQYRAYQREVINTETSLNKLQNQLASVGQAQQDLDSKTKQLETLFKATGTSVDQYADALGVGLTNAIKNGTASSKQLDTAIEKVGKAALGTSIDVDKLKSALKTVDDGASLKAVKKDLSNVAKEAKEAGDEVNNFGDNLSTVIGGLAAGGGIAGVISKSLDTSSLNTKIDISFNVPEESKESVRQAVRGLEAYGLDGQEALEGIRRQWALNKEASDEANAAVVNMAGTIATAYSGIDFNELIQEGNEIASTLGITNEEAMGLVNTLLKTGFPPEQLDIIAEYGDQMIQAGFSAQEVQAIMAAGVDTKSWNIDNLLDGVKEGRIQMADFGNGLDKSMKEIISQTDISAKQFVGWGQAIAKGGEGGQKAMLEATKALAGVEDATVRNQLGTKMFGTMWEDQGMKIVDTIIKAEGKQVDLKKGVDDLAESQKKLDTDPTVQMRQAFTDMQTSLAPLLTTIAELISKIGEWVSNNPTLAATIAAVVAGIGILIGVCMALAPIFVTLTGAAGLFGIAIGPLVLIIAGIVTAIGLLVAAGIALYKNWDEIKAYAAELVTSISEKFQEFKEAIATKMQEALEKIKEIWNNVMNFFRSINIIEDAKRIFSTFINGIGAKITETVNKAKELWNNVITFIKGINIMENAKAIFSTFINGIGAMISGTVAKVTELWNRAVSFINSINIIENAKRIFSTFISGIGEKISATKSKVVELWNGAKSFLESISLISIGKNIIQGLIDGIGSMADALWKKVKGIANSIKDTFTDLLDIHSPSRVFKGYGININEGLIEGIQLSSTRLENAMQNVYGSLVNSANKMMQTPNNAYNTNTNDYSRKMTNHITISSSNNSTRDLERVMRRLAFKF